MSSDASYPTKLASQGNIALAAKLPNLSECLISSVRISNVRTRINFMRDVVFENRKKGSHTVQPQRKFAFPSLEQRLEIAGE